MKPEKGTPPEKQTPPKIEKEKQGRRKPALLLYKG